MLFGVAGQATLHSLKSQERDPVPNVQEAGWDQGQSGGVRKIPYPTGIRSPERTYRGDSLYRIGVIWLVTMEGWGAMFTVALFLINRWLMFLYVASLEIKVFHFSLSLHHPNNCLQNTSIFFICPFSTHYPKNLFLGRTNVGGSFVQLVGTSTKLRLQLHRKRPSRFPSISLYICSKY